MIWKLTASVFLLSLTTSILGEDIPSSQNILNVTNCGKRLIKTNTDRVVGGDRARHGRNPWMVALLERYDDWGNYEDFDFKCGGAILNENWIVTAASCLRNPEKYWNYVALTGLYKLSEQDGPTVRRHKISKVVLPKDYNSWSPYKINIALLKVKNPIDFEASEGYANPICLPKDTEEPAGFATTVGWGRNKAFVNKLSDTLNEVVVPIVPSALCPNYENNICAGKKGKNFCHNDGGSPLFQEDYHSIVTLLGVVSTNFDCGESESPGQYTRISMYLDWIRKVISEN